MKAPQLTPHDALWFCRHLAAALPGSSSLLVALEAIAHEVPPSGHAFLASLRARVSAGEPLSAELRSWGLPAYACEAVREGEGRNLVPEALARVAEQLEAEGTGWPAGEVELQAFARTFGRLAVMLACGVALPLALARAEESAAEEEVQEVLRATREALEQGTGFAEALARLAPDLPEPTLEMIGEGEATGRLDFTLCVVADYLCDQAKEATQTQEVSRG